jgi:uncharacterized repeat protein (TIGR01451 family)
MKYSIILLWMLGSHLLASLPVTGGSQTNHPTGGATAQIYNLPVQFEPNVGQAPDEVRFLSRGPGYSLLLTPAEMVMSLQARESEDSERRTRGRRHARTAGRALPSTELRVRVVGANPSTEIQGVEELPGTVNYFVGNDPREWRSSIRTYAKVKYQQVYPNIDLVYYGNPRQMEYDFIVGVGADPAGIALEFSGQERLEISGKGDLEAHFKGRVLRWREPFAYQETDSGRKEVPVRFVLKDGCVAGFQIGDYDRSKPLIIDPAVNYATYLGGSGDDFASDIALDPASNNVVVVGTTSSLNFPTANAYRSSSAGSNDIYITRFNNTGSGIVFSTYLGGSGNEFAGGIALDSSGNIYITGQSDSPNFPTKNAYSSANAGFNDAFIAKLGPSGNTLLYASYLGGGGDDSGNAIAVDNNGNAYIAGDTFSIGTGNDPFPITHGAFQSKNNGGRDAFVAEFNTTLSGSSSLVYSTFLGGSTDEKAWAIAVDSSGNACVAGEIQSFNNVYPAPPTSDFPTLNAFEPAFNLGSIDSDAGAYDGFVTKLNAAGTGLIFSTYLGGGDDDFATGITLDASGKIYVAGQSSSPDFITTTNAAQPVNAGLVYTPDFPGFDAFVTVFQPNGALYYSTLLGGSADEDGLDVFPMGVAVDRFGMIYLGGQTQSDDFPTTAGADITNTFAQSDIFIAKINPQVSGPNAIVYCSRFSGDLDARGGVGAANYFGGVVVDANAGFYLCGTTTATNFPTTTGAFRTRSSGGFYDSVVGKFSSPRDMSVSMVPSLEPVIVGSNFVYAIQVNNNGNSSFSGVTNTVQLSTNVQILSVTTSAGTYTTNYNAVTGWLVTFNLGTVTNYSAVTQSITLKTVWPGFTTNVANLTSLEQAAGLEPNTGNNTAIVPNTIVGIVDVKINQLSASANPTAVFSNFNYTVAIGNKGQYPASSLVVTDTLPSQVMLNWATNSQGTPCSLDYSNGFVSCTLYNLTSGGAASLVINVTPLSGGYAIDYAGVIPFDYDSNPANNYSNLITFIVAQADLALGESQSANSLFVGNNLTYNISVTNRGPSGLSTPVITDQLPPGFALVSSSTTQGSISQNNGLIMCNLGPMASNATAAVSLIVQPSAAGTFTNTATITSEGLDPNTNNNSASSVVVVNPWADLSVTETAPSTAFLSSNVVFSFSVVNRGPSPATGVILTDALPSGVSFVSAASSQGSYSASNGVVTFSLGALSSNATATATVTTRAQSVGVFSNVGNVVGNEPDLATNNNRASVTVSLLENANNPLLKIRSVQTNVVLYWSANSVGFGLQSEPDLFITTVWTTVTNVPVVVGNQFFVTNPVPPGSFYRLFKPSVPQADLALGQTQSANSLYVGSNLTYNISVTNGGPFGVTSPVITDQLPPGFALVSSSTTQGSISQNNGLITCNLGPMAGNATAAVSLIVQPSAAGTFTNTATITSEGLDPNTNNNSASSVVVVNPWADLSLTETVSPGTAFLSSNVVFSFSVVNRGPSPATGVMLADPLPSGVSFVSAASSQGSYSASNGVITFSLGALSSNATATATVTTRAQSVGVFSNVGNVVGNEPDLATNNNRASVTVSLLENANNPLLKIRSVQTNVVLYWSTNSLGFVLQTKPNLFTTTIWTAVTNVPVVVGNQFFVTNAAVPPGNFYRLSKLPSVTLAITKSGTKVVIYWPASLGGALKTATVLSTNTSSWSPVTTVPVLQNGFYYVTNSLPGNTRFFRLFN